MAAMLVLATAIVVPAAVLKPGTEIVLSRRVVTIADVADIVGISDAGRLRGIEIMRIRGDASRWRLSHRAIATLIRRAVPGLIVPAGDTAIVTLRLPPRAVASPTATVRWTRPAPSVARGDKLTLVSRAGVVIVERPVTALQSGHAGGRVFVQDNAGKVFAAPVAEEQR